MSELSRLSRVLSRNRVNRKSLLLQCLSRTSNHECRDLMHNLHVRHPLFGRNIRTHIGYDHQAQQILLRAFSCEHGLLSLASRIVVILLDRKSQASFSFSHQPPSDSPHRILRVMIRQRDFVKHDPSQRWNPCQKKLYGRVPCIRPGRLGEGTCELIGRFTCSRGVPILDGVEIVVESGETNDIQCAP